MSTNAILLNRRFSEWSRALTAHRRTPQRRAKERLRRARQSFRAAVTGDDRYDAWVRIEEAKQELRRCGIGRA